MPIINIVKCDGCGLCVRVCPTKALELRDQKALVAHPEVCDYIGLCEAVCPKHAISRPFEIVIVQNKD
ncbi:MAG: 4Fe-4S dicluster domain-containing protein [Chloroflexi bacterium]|nr:MAG: 4Fe-4S dicluster domain-containing protein [Chloroflexota bacterium]MBL1194986.1 4Fe-4S dicluster domain-containing protein [Chloroflexota bacterium]NOH12274.1 4Fe-4S binding protein [Chloroflexota bacterium]